MAFVLFGIASGRFVGVLADSAAGFTSYTWGALGFEAVSLVIALALLGRGGEETTPGKLAHSMSQQSKTAASRFHGPIGSEPLGSSMTSCDSADSIGTGVAAGLFTEGLGECRVDESCDALDSKCQYEKEGRSVRLQSFFC